MESEQVICIHPNLQTRGSIKEDGETSYQISLKDCLACSGCAITDDEISILSKQDPSLVLNELQNHPGFVVLVSSVAVANLSAAKHISLSQAFFLIAKYFKELGASKVVIDTDVQIAWRKLLADGLNNSPTKPYIISRCAGSVVYFERKSEYGACLAQIKPYSQLFAMVEKQKRGATYVISVGPCYDRKLETARFEGDIDASLTISEIADFLNPSDDDSESSCQVKFPKGNDVEAVLKIATKSEPSSNTAKKYQTEYSAGGLRGAMVSGMSAHKTLTRRNAIEAFDLIEADLCPGGCGAGGGLIKGEGSKGRQELVAATNAAHADPAVLIEDSPEAEELYQELLTMEIGATYKSEEKEEKAAAENLDW